MIKGAVEVAQEIAMKSPVAVQSTKVALVYARDHSVQEGLNQIVSCLFDSKYKHSECSYNYESRFLYTYLLCTKKIINQISAFWELSSYFQVISQAEKIN